MRIAMFCFGLVLMFISSGADAQEAAREPIPTTFLSITVVNITTGLPITNGETLPAGDYSISVTVTDGGTNCMGQYEAVARFVTNFPMLRLTSALFMIGKDASADSVTFPPLYPIQNLDNKPGDYKLIATCGAFTENSFGVALFEFMVAAN